MALDYTVKVVDVHKDNIKVIWPCLIHSVQSASFIALDCELSGLGNRKLINAQAVDDRYKHIGNVAKTRSIISIGLCCFRSDALSSQSVKDQPAGISFEVQTFNLMALCAEEYVVEPPALQFLVNHDFDFQKQYSKGIPYCRGSQIGQEGKENTSKNWNLRDLFDALILARVPIVLHNGLVDLVFLYQNLYAELPPTLSTFLADLDMMFPGGIYDTKYMAEFELRISASFLVKICSRYSQLHNMEVKHKKQMHIRCIHSIPDSEFTDVWDCSPKLQEIPRSSEICTDYSNYGHCRNGNACARSHDIFRVVMEEKEKKARKRRRTDQEGSDERFDALSHFDQTPSQERFKGHRAGHDAFMTAFSFASFLVRKLAAKRGKTEQTVFADLTKDVQNRICLSGKDFPLLVKKSNFSKNSKGHLARYAKLVPQTPETKDGYSSSCLSVI